MKCAVCGAPITAYYEVNGKKICEVCSNESVYDMFLGGIIPLVDTVVGDDGVVNDTAFPEPSKLNGVTVIDAEFTPIV